MTRLGWHFAFVGTFAMVGGAIRGFNLPLVLAGLIIGALLTHWRLGRHTIEAIKCRRRLPEEAFVGQSFPVRFLVTNHSRWIPAWLIRIDDRIDTSTGADKRPLAKRPTFFSMPVWREPASGLASCGVGAIARRRTVVATYDCVASKRGCYEFGPLTISTGMPLGLISVAQVDSERQSICVYPELLPLRRDWRRRLQSRSGGMATTARRSGANDGDFFGLRSWQAGDSRRWIHWRTTARIGEPAVRQFEQQRRFDLCVLVDAFWPTDAFDHEQDGSSSSAAADSLELAISAAASLITHIVPTPTNRVALAVAGRVNAIVAGGGSRGQLTAMLQVLAEAAPSTDPSLVAAVDNVFRSVGKPQDLVVISPRMMPAAAERMGRLLSGRCSLRWYSVEDRSIDLLVDRVRGRQADATQGDESATMEMA